MKCYEYWNALVLNSEEIDSICLKKPQ